MNPTANARTCLTLLLWFAAIHSFLVGLGLVLLPASAMSFFGLIPYVERFFPVQGGVFHIVMSVAYTLAAIRTDRFLQLIVFAIVAKLMAAVFLFTYYIAIDGIWVILLSGAGDGLMGLALLLAFRAYRRRLAGPAAHGQR